MDFENKQNKIEEFAPEKKPENEKNLEIYDVINNGEKRLSGASEKISNENIQAISHVENYPGTESRDIENTQGIITETNQKINQVIENTQKNVREIVGKNSETNQEKDLNQEKRPSQDDLREVNIIKRIDNKFSGRENRDEFLNISRKITEKIKGLPDNKKEVYWQKMLSLVKSEQNNDIYYYKELHDEALNELKMVEKNSSLKNRDMAIEDRITKCSSFEDLDVVLSSSEGLSGSSNNYDSENLKNIISDVKNFKLPLNALTRSAGLRDKVKNLLATPDPLVTTNRFEVTTADGTNIWESQNTPNPELIRLNRGRHWELISKSEYKEILHKAKEDEIGAYVDLLDKYKKENLGEKRNSMINFINNEFIFTKNHLGEIKENLSILYEKTNTPIYKKLLDYINSSENKFDGNQESPFLKKIKSLKEKSN
ncbi:MAG TPA: hypothetical protein PLA05_02300 [bacterium]|nr:MAG: hypothetical protein BWX82_00103 [Parcubacteria group bacterium ADurb.Bin115]HNU81303.1 hypothetical protein [bacterium]HPW05774.1 hypothetical protein [bacterium]